MKFHQKSLINAGAALVVISLAFLGRMSAPAVADEDRQAAARDKARAMINQMTRHVMVQLSETPAMRTLARTISTDCAAKNKGKSEQSEFCTCASVVTLSLWQHKDIGSQIAPLLKTFLENPSEPKAKRFLKYQGPELYGPLCHLAVDD